MPDSIKKLLESFSAGEASAEEVLARLRSLPFEDLGFAKVDHHRQVRIGLPETIYGPGKRPEHLDAIVRELLSFPDGAVLITKATSDQFHRVREIEPEATFHETCGVIVVRPASSSPTGVVAIASAGTSDIPVAEEAAVTCEALGLKAERIYDIGVAGIHRLLDSRADLDRADVVVVVAGMDGALASIVGGLVAAPVVAVPTSVGYGAGAGGIAPLLTMLNACSPGVAVVNIDNGYGAAVFAWTILNRSAR